MFWIALELSNPMVGLITRLSLLAKNLTTFKFGKVAKSGNAARVVFSSTSIILHHSFPFSTANSCVGCVKAQV